MRCNGEYDQGMEATVGEETTAWLMDGDPAIRWQAMQDLLDVSAAEVAQERAKVATTGWGKRLLDLQDPEGTWAGGLYSPKWVSTTYTLLLLYRCGLAPGTPAAVRGVKLLWDGARYFDGGLTCGKTVDYPEACVTSMYTTLARYFGFDDDRVEVALAWLLANQLDDGGWNCRNVRWGDTHSSFHTSISALEALAETLRRQPDRKDVTTAMARGREFFLKHRLYKSHRSGEPADPVFAMLSFPPRWHYDLLRGLDHFQSVSSPWDERFGDALAVLTDKRRRDGKWPVQHRHGGRVWFDMETGRQPSRWNTLRAMRVLRWAAVASRD
jgi:hypothetical protein